MVVMVLKKLGLLKSQTDKYVLHITQVQNAKPTLKLAEDIHRFTGNPSSHAPSSIQGPLSHLFKLGMVLKKFGWGLGGPIAIPLPSSAKGYFH
jgi:hypothetical protein